MSGKSKHPSPERLLQGEITKPELSMGEASISVSLTSLMSVVVFFFIGLLLTGRDVSQLRLRIPLLLLFLSAFGFLYATLIYANASGEVSRLRKRSFETQMCIGNILSEYLGVYCLVLAIPMTVLGYSPDRVLAISVAVISLMGFLLYHLMGYSILERYSHNKFVFFVTVAWLTLCGTAMFFFFFVERVGAHFIATGLLVSTIVVLCVYSCKHKEN